MSVVGLPIGFGLSDFSPVVVIFGILSDGVGLRDDSFLLKRFTLRS